MFQFNCHRFEHIFNFRIKVGIDQFYGLDLRKGIIRAAGFSLMFMYVAPGGPPRCLTGECTIWVARLWLQNSEAQGLFY